MKNAIRILSVLAWVATASAEVVSFSARHERGVGHCEGTLRFEETEVRWTPSKHSHSCRDLAWKYGEMQRLEMEEKRITITGYADRRWYIGEDARWRFHLASPAGPALYALLRTKMDTRFAPHYAEPLTSPLWGVPAKMLSKTFPSGNWGGEGILEIGADRVVFRSVKPGYARTWLDSEIENVAAERPYLFTMAVREGGVSVLRTFQLKRELEADKFDALWLRLNRPRGLQLLTNLEEPSK